MVPAPMSETQPQEDVLEPLNAEPVLHNWVRGTLILIATGLVAVFTIAIILDPYQDDGRARTMETHRQLGLPPCTFYSVTGLPCPSCGMTTSFTLLMHGDLLNSLRANAVGTLLAMFCLLLIPWSLYGILVGRPLFINSIEPTLVRVVMVFMVLTLLRWVIVLGVIGMQKLGWM